IHLSQLSVIGAAKVSYFEILYRIHDFALSMGLFRKLYINSISHGWLSFSKRPGANTLCCYTKVLDSLNNWNNKFFRIDKSVIPLSLMWLTASSIRQDPPSSVNQFDVQEYMDLSAYVKHSCGPFGHPCCSGYTARTRCYFRCPETADIVLVVDEENNVVAGGSRGVKRRVTRSPPNHPPKKILADVGSSIAAPPKRVGSTTDSSSASQGTTSKAVVQPD
ncbi:hypothetical protein Tco_1127682, partial [Tanacetum coccineum]